MIKNILEHLFFWVRLVIPKVCLFRRFVIPNTHISYNWHVELTRIDPVHNVPGLSAHCLSLIAIALAAARALQRLPQSVTIYDRNLTRGRSSALTLRSVFAHISNRRSENIRMREMLSRDTRTHSSGSAFPKLCAQLSIFPAVGTSGHFFLLLQCAWFLHDLLEWIFIRILQFEFLKSATPFSSYRFLKLLNLPTFFPGVKSSILLFSLFYWWHRFVYPYMLCLWLITN